MLIVGKSQQSQMEADVTEPETLTWTATTTMSSFMELNVLFLNTANRDFDTRRLSGIPRVDVGLKVNTCIDDLRFRVAELVRQAFKVEVDPQTLKFYTVCTYVYDYQVLGSKSFSSKTRSLLKTCLRQPRSPRMQIWLGTISRTRKNWRELARKIFSLSKERVFI